ncbi:MAG TPA: O-antigen ligase family protein [Candidatus Methylomirabilis sp.]|nr:O-antigen ligase family protein [Candidatus Methylomirabilis sp.]
MTAAAGKGPTLPTLHISSLLFVCALLPAILFKGPQLEIFAIAQIMLAIACGWALWQSYDSGLILPKTALALTLTLFWAWLAASILWSRAPAISTINFWWIGSLVLVFWLYTLTPDRQVLWSHAAAVLLVLGLVLALMGIYQALVFGQDARSIFETRNTQAAFLNLIALPASAHFLLMIGDDHAPRKYPALLGAVLYALFSSIFLTASRGAALSLALSMGVLVALTVRYTSRRGTIALLALLAAAFLTTKITHDGLDQRVLHLAQDYFNRWVIWESSWSLLKASPWHGIGPGLFYLAYPPYRHPADSSDGFFVHNDYLQIWIEAGLPGLLLLVSVLGATLWLLVRVLRKKNLNKKIRIELVGLFCGLLAVASHSFVDFNLYILSIMMISGLVMGRYHELARRELKSPTMQIRFSRNIGRQAYPIIVVVLVLLPMFHFVILGLANSYYDKALRQERQGKLQEADQSLAAAEWLTPADDRMLIAHADLYRHAITLLPPDVESSKKLLFGEALEFLDKAQQANSLRGLTFVIRGRIYQLNPALAGDNGYDLAAESFRCALRLDPRLFQGRTDYAMLLLQSGKKQEALQILEEGVKYDYPDTPGLIPFYSLTARLRREAGDAERAKELEDKVASLKKRTADSYFLTGY